LFRSNGSKNPKISQRISAKRDKDESGFVHYKSRSFKVEKEGNLEWKPRKIAAHSARQPRILVDNVEIQGLDGNGSLKVCMGQQVEIIEMTVKKP
jgi:hypothetical protein